VPQLDDDKPLDVIAAGHYRRVAQLSSGLEEPGAAQPSRGRGWLVADLAARLGAEAATRPAHPVTLHVVKRR
jgi:hypothetical protein